MRSNYLLLRLAVVGVALVIAGVAMIIGNVADKKSISTGVLDINTVSLSDLEKGRFVEGDIPYVCGEFAYLEEYNSTFGVKHNERVTNHYYVVPLVGGDSDEDRYVAIEVGNANMVDTAETMIDEFWDAVDSEDWSKATTSLHFQGKVEKMNDELSGYMYEFFTYLYEDMSKEDMDTITCPYVIKYIAPGYESRSSVAAVIILLVGIALSGITAVFFIKARKDRKARDEALAQSFTGYGNGASESDPINGYTPVNSVPSGNVSDSISQSMTDTNSKDHVLPWEK